MTVKLPPAGSPSGRRLRRRDCGAHRRSHRPGAGDVREIRALPGGGGRFHRGATGEVCGPAGLRGVPRRRRGPAARGQPSRSRVRGVPRPPGGARRRPVGCHAAGPAGSVLLRSLPRVQRLPAHRLSADRSGDAQPAEALHHLSRSARPRAAPRAAGMQRLPRTDCAAQGRVAPREPAVRHLPHRAAGAQGQPARRPGPPSRPIARSAASATTRRRLACRKRRGSTSLRTISATCAGSAITPTIPRPSDAGRRPCARRRPGAGGPRTAESPAVRGGRPQGLWRCRSAAGGRHPDPRCRRPGSGGGRRGRLRPDRPLLRDGHRHRQVHRLRSLRRRLQGGERRPARRRPLPLPGSSATSSQTTARSTVDSPNGGIDGFPPLDERKRRAAHRSSFPSSATTAPTRPACRSARSGPPSPRVTASCWWTRTTASAAATASRPARTARAGSHPTKRVAGKCTLLLPPHRPGAGAGLRRGVPHGRPNLRRGRTARRRRSPGSCACNDVQVLKPHLNTEPKVYYANLDGEVPREACRATSTRTSTSSNGAC